MKRRNWAAFAAGFMAVCCLAFALEAHATKPKPMPKGAEANARASADAQADASARAAAEASGGHAEAHGGNAEASQSQEANANNAGNTQIINFQDENDVTIRNVASPNPPSIMSSHACALGGSGGIGIPSVSISGGKQKVDWECVRREEARLLSALGERELAVMHLCNAPTMQESLGQACGPSVTQEELRRRIDFLLEERERDRLRVIEEKEALKARCAESNRRAEKACRK